MVAELVLEDISVDYRSPGVNEPLQFKIEECTGAMNAGKPFTLALKEPAERTIQDDHRDRFAERTPGGKQITDGN